MHDNYFLFQNWNNEYNLRQFSSALNKKSIQELIENSHNLLVFKLPIFLMKFHLKYFKGKHLVQIKKS